MAARRREVIARLRGQGAHGLAILPAGLFVAEIFQAKSLLKASLYYHREKIKNGLAIVNTEESMGGIGQPQGPGKPGQDAHLFPHAHQGLGQVELRSIKAVSKAVGH